MQRLLNDLGGADPVYRVYVIGADERIQSAAPIIALDDETAIQAARNLVDGHAVELWDRGRKIIRFEAKSQTSNHSD